MSEARIQLGGQDLGHASIDESRVLARGHKAFPYLLVPLAFQLRQLGSRENPAPWRSIWLQCELLMENEVIAVAVGQHAGLHVYESNHKQEIAVRFPMHTTQVATLAECRWSRNPLALQGELLVAEQSGEEPQRWASPIRSIDRASFQVPLNLNQSHWLEKILPGLGHDPRRLIELPVPAVPHAERWRMQTLALEQALQLFDRGDFDSAAARCRSILEALDKALVPALTTQEPLDHQDQQERRIASLARCLVQDTRTWMHRVVDRSKQIAHAPVHSPAMGHLDRDSAQALLLITTAALSFGPRLIEEADAGVS